MRSRKLSRSISKMIVSKPYMRTIPLLLIQAILSKYSVINVGPVLTRKFNSFKKTKAMAALLDERTKRQPAQNQTDISSQVDNSGERSLKSLVDSVKRKSTQQSGKGLGKRRRVWDTCILAHSITAYCIYLSDFFQCHQQYSDYFLVCHNNGPSHFLTLNK